MSSQNLPQETPLISYLVVKHSWRGKYKRVWSICKSCINTVNPNTISKDSTNKWSYDTIISISPVGKLPSTEFLITSKKDTGKIGNMKFSSDYRTDLITDSLKQMANQNYVGKNIQKFKGTKYLWNSQTMDVLLYVHPAWIRVTDMANVLITDYDLRYIDNLIDVDYNFGGISIKYGGFGRNHLFAIDQRNEFVQSVIIAASSNLGIDTVYNRSMISFDAFLESRLGSCGYDEALTSYVEFSVIKISRYRSQEIRRLFCVTSSCLVERDPLSYNVTTCRKLSNVFSVICSSEDPQLFSIEFTNEDIRSYISSSRDMVVTSLLDAVRASGNSDVHVKANPTNRGYRFVPFYAQAGEEIERIHLKALNQIDYDNGSEVVDRFNANVAYRGLVHSVTADTLFADNKEKLICQALVGVTSVSIDKFDQNMFSSYLFAIRRLFASKAGFNSFTRLPGMRERLGVMVVKALKLGNDFVTHAAIEVICTLMQPMHYDSDLQQEQLNKTSLLSSKQFLSDILSTFLGHINNRTGALVVASFLDLLTYALCYPYSETTPADKFDILLDLVTDLGRPLFKLFEHPSLAIVKGAGLLLNSLIEEGTTANAEKMQIFALAEGSLIRHLCIALFTTSNEPRMLAHKSLEFIFPRQLSRRLLELWTCDNEVTFSLFSRILPPGLVSFLYSSETVDVTEKDLLHVRDTVAIAQQKASTGKNQALKMVEEKIDNFLQHWRLGFRHNKPPSNEVIVTLRRPRRRVISMLNWKLFYHKFNRDHSYAELIWNFKTREELRIALENEIRGLDRDKELFGNADMSWNFQEFEVAYKSTEDILNIGGYYIRYLLEDNSKNLIKDPYRLFNDLFRKFLTSSSTLRWTCLHAMTSIYEMYYTDVGNLSDCFFFMTLLDNCTQRFERDRLIIFISKLMLLKENCKILLTPPNVKKLLEMMTLAHLHLTRAVLPTQSNLIEAAPTENSRFIAKEWYIAAGTNKSLGPYSLGDLIEFQKEEKISFKTRVWCNGMDNWASINLVPQLKWQLSTMDNSILTESDIAILLLNTMISVCEFYPSRDSNNSIFHPIPRIKRLLSTGSNFSHLVQLLLTFYPPIVERVALLLCKIVEDNPVLPKLYQSGVFFFIMMYTGSNIYPIASFLKMTHDKQSFYCEREGVSDIVKNSILNNLLPDAMINYLVNYSPDEFSRIYLGDFDNPEVIWNTSMKNRMIERIAVHISDYTVRLMSNVRALYQFCPIPLIIYPPLEDELFCNIFYLRNFCDLQRFPDWPVRDPVVFLKDLLNSWKEETEKKPTKMNTSTACDILGLKEHEISESKIRHSYFKMAQKYHPDKNIEGREMFEKMSSAYRFLTDKSAHKSGPDDNNIILLLKAQSIIFSRFVEELNPYKYAGYPMLFMALRKEVNDVDLFDKKTSLLDSATELCYWTIKCSHLNAEELRRENGLQVLQTCFGRCSQMLSKSSSDNDRPAKISANVLKCFSVASMFDGSQTLIKQMSTLIDDIVLMLRFTDNLPRTCHDTILCIKSLSCVQILQMSLFQRSVLCYLCPLLFHYDYTLEEGGIQSNEESNQQALLNQLAIVSIGSISCLCGFDTTLTDKEPVFNGLVRKSISLFLTPYILSLLEDSDYKEALKVLNCNSRNPYMLWDLTCRKELNEYCAEQINLINNRCEVDPFLGAEFVYSLHEDELNIEGVYITVYNEQPLYAIKDPIGLSIGLYEFIKYHTKYFTTNNCSDLPPKEHSFVVRNVVECIQALHNLLNVYTDLHKLSIPAMDSLMSLFYISNSEDIVVKLLQLMILVADNQECINNIADIELTGYLIFGLYSYPNLKDQFVVLLTSMLSHNKIIKECHNKGLLIYSLDIFCSSIDPSLRTSSIMMLSKMMGDKLLGPRIRIEINKFLPHLFIDSMRDSSSTTLQLFDNNSENPELIWNGKIRNSISKYVADLAGKHYNNQCCAPQSVFKISDTMEALHDDITDELMIGGVYIRLFLNNPRWVLHRPREFIVEIINELFRLSADRSLQKRKGDLELIGNAIVLLFSSQPAMMDMLIQIGVLPKFLQAIEVSTGDIIFLIVKILHQIVKNQGCINALSSYECVKPLKRALLYSVESLEVTVNTLYYLALHESSVFIAQALSCRVFDTLLEFLGSELGVDNSKAIKALIVKTLKQFAASPTYKSEINRILDGSVTWKDYKDQLHDLFITNSSNIGYITAAPNNVAGYLTSSTVDDDLNLMQPPPNI